MKRHILGALALLFTTAALMFLPACAGSAVDNDFRTRVESVSASAAKTHEGAEGSITVHLRDPRGFAK